MRTLAGIHQYCPSPSIEHVDADQIGQLIDHLGDRLRQDAYRINIPFWELPNLPDAWTAAFDLVDEIWAPTHFIQTMLLRKIKKPVIRMPLTLDFAPPPVLARSHFGLPEDKFLFFFAFDYFSFLERKIPLAALRAFKRGFRNTHRATSAALVIKTINSEQVPEKGRGPS